MPDKKRAKARTVFKPGNEIGKETRFQPGNTDSSKYKEEYCEQIINYYRSYKGYPTTELFADSIGVVTDTLRNWAEKHPRFRLAYQRALEIQRGKLIEGGLLNTFNPAIVKFVAVNCHGMSDRVVQESAQEAPFQVNINVVK